ncbi:acyl carrier protein [Acanthopleuribacter pedis]|uniref:Carrier domain-containing protein n=1 Tax=Acanthopleuribacter pedis TaxID=442870 RepID=A0A8J7Q290_9BACT|nr:phosphopantetheine-binding protein [Acanthopleuribacter pedis]MBO1319177.1 hypothetical protein [Acanthopleuribacter pedis]
MPNVPSLAELAAKVEELLYETTDIDNQPVPHDRPLMGEIGLDSLDMIELGFAMDEFFGFQFSDRNAVELLDERLGGGVLVAPTGYLTEQGRAMVLRRMPELEHLDLPEPLKMVEVQQYYTLETFARLMREFYVALPETCPETGEAVEVVDFVPQTAEGKVRVEPPRGDVLIDQWVDRAALEINAEPVA